VKLETIARKIMRKMKGWKKRDQDEDFREYADVHRSELQWVVRELEKAQQLRNPPRRKK
jgi:hypothetical protein